MDLMDNTINSFHLTALALSHLSTMIMTIVLIGFLWRLRRKPDTTWLLICLILIWFWLLGLFLDQTLAHTPWSWCWIISIVIYLVYIPLIQFTYHFPSPTPHLRREAKIALFLSVMASPFTLWDILARLIAVTTGKNFGGINVIMDAVLLAGTFWAIVVLLRRTVYFSTRQTKARWLHCLVWPQGRQAHATRAFMLVGLIPLAGVIIAFSTTVEVSGYQNTVTGLLMVFATGVVYFNAVPEESTFMVKLVSITLVTLLVALGFVGYTIEPFYRSAYAYQAGTTNISQSQYIHERMLPLAYLIVGTSVFILTVFPVFFHVNLVKPLANLLGGVRRVNAGDLSVSAPVGVADEIGFLTRSFNEMVRSLHRSEASLRESEMRFRTLFEHAPLCIFEVDCSPAPPRIIRANHQAERTFGWTSGELVDVPLGEIIPPQAKGNHIDISDILHSTDLTALESAGRRRDGSTFPIRISVAPGGTGGSSECILIVEDITAEKARRSEEEAIAEERRRIAREIHDGLAQNLASLRFRADVWHTLLERDPAKLHAELDHLQELLAQNIRDVRRSIFALRPVALEELGFYPALDQFINDFGEQNQLRVDLQLVGPRDRLPPSLEPVLFRIIQEALNNVGKHAQANTVSIRLDLESSDGVTLQIRDDGSGFDSATLDQAIREGRTGLRHIREKAENLHGSFSLRIRPGGGTEVRVELPLGS
jgi:PAS domain S-box-containing protein